MNDLGGSWGQLIYRSGGGRYNDHIHNSRSKSILQIMEPPQFGIRRAGQQIIIAGVFCYERPNKQDVTGWICAQVDKKKSRDQVISRDMTQSCVNHHHNSLTSLTNTGEDNQPAII